MVSRGDCDLYVCSTLEAQAGAMVVTSIYTFLRNFFLKFLLIITQFEISDGELVKICDMANYF